jgi:hypothetical protein
VLARDANAFEGEHKFFALQARAESSKPAIGADDAVAWNNDGDGVAPISSAHGSEGLGLAAARGELGVAYGRAKGNISKSCPYRKIKGRASRSKRHMEGGECPLEVGFNLFNGILQVRLGAFRREGTFFCIQGFQGVIVKPAGSKALGACQ